MKRVRTFLILSIIGLFCFTIACKKKSTKPTNGSGGVTFSSVSFGGAFVNSNAEATILHTDLLLDGSIIASDDYSTPSSTSVLATALYNSVKKGQHTILLRMTNQSSSPNTYIIFGQIETVEGFSTTKTYTIGGDGDLVRSLATGESFSWTVNLQ